MTKGDIGTGTILGSAVFNVLFVIGICALFSGHVSCLSFLQHLLQKLLIQNNLLFYFSCSICLGGQ